MADTTNTYVTEEELREFADQVHECVLNTIASEEVAYTELVKEFVDSKVVELENKLVNNEDWVKAKKTIDALLAVFDENTDGSLSAEELLTKIGEFKANIDALSAKINEVESKIDSGLSDLNAKIAVNEASIKDVSTKVDEALTNYNETVEKVTGLEDSITDINTRIDDVESRIETVAQAAADGVSEELESTVATLKEDIETFKNNVGTVVADAQTEVKTEIITEVKTEVSAMFSGMQEAFAASCDAAKATLNERMANLRSAFGLPTETETTETTVDGDGAVV
jgi:predicted  nucleic acid-binding Zn-ribbon protein